jgi:hypothetical protein
MERYRVKIVDKYGETLMDRRFNFCGIYYENEVMMWLLRNYASEMSDVNIRRAKITKLL